jgi:preprotein translocase subunit YajC
VDFVIMIGLGFVLIWLLIVMPQRRRAAAHRRLLDAVNPGDEVVTVGGLMGRVTRIDEDEVGVEVARGVEVRVARRAIAAVLPPEGSGSSSAA